MKLSTNVTYLEIKWDTSESVNTTNMANSWSLPILDVLCVEGVSWLKRRRKQFALQRMQVTMMFFDLLAVELSFWN